MDSMNTKERLLHACNTLIADASQVIYKLKKINPASTYEEAAQLRVDCGICYLLDSFVLDDVIQNYISESGINLRPGLKYMYIFPTLHQIGHAKEPMMFERDKMKIGTKAYLNAIVPRIGLLEIIIFETVKLQEQINNGKFKINDTWELQS